MNKTKTSMPKTHHAPAPQRFSATKQSERDSRALDCVPWATVKEVICSWRLERDAVAAAANTRRPSLALSLRGVAVAKRTRRGTSFTGKNSKANGQTRGAGRREEREGWRGARGQPACWGARPPRHLCTTSVRLEFS